MVFCYVSGFSIIGYERHAAWQNAVELCTMLCQKYDLTETHIICHSEGYKKGITSNHGDILHPHILETAHEVSFEDCFAGLFSLIVRPRKKIPSSVIGRMPDIVRNI